MLRVNAYTTGYNAPSARYRVRQLIPFLSELGVDVNEIYSQTGAFPPPDRKDQMAWGVKNLLENGLKVCNQPQADITWLQKVMFSKHYTFERFLRKPLVFDVDDAIFKPDPSFVKKIAQQSQKIICGNTYLADHFSKWNKNIDIIPTAVDVSRYEKIVPDTKKECLYILWTGTSSGYPFVYNIEESLKIIVDKYNYVKIKIVSNEKPNFNFLQTDDYIFEYWSRENEFTSIVNADIGIMPLIDNDRARGKCSYKMLCYMAAGLPVVVSPVGMNKDVLMLDDIGFEASSVDEWVQCLEVLILNEKKRLVCSSNALSVVKVHFDVAVVSKKIEMSFNSLI
ncbi:hypothetical protein [uncultured Dokdonia sp.]|mgnify:CR=1 FL=1|uniref:hypothetical protein n=1 Tax=uncultured Dokdonia sp. TaxID=575653 RepID=UPI0030EBDFD7|tara:strand:+ start:31917 stop:32930 length:1014 start_codon:yes stop_codon:yes gene_type:complete